jgi:hypothetical protein
MRRVCLIILLCVGTGCTSTAHDSDGAVTTAPANSLDRTETVAATRQLPVSTAEACSTDNDALAVAKTFIVAAESGDQTTIVRCTYSVSPLNPDLISIVASGGWLLDQVRPVPGNSSLRLGPGAVGFAFPNSPQSRGTYIDGQGQSVSFGPDYQSGVMIAVTLEPDGLRYVTDVLGYGSA